MGFTRPQLENCKNALVPDVIGPETRLLFVGINPGLQTAMTGIHFAHPTNRFWPALRKAGLIDWSPQLTPSTPAVPLEIGKGKEPIKPDPGLVSIKGVDVGFSASQRRDFIASGLGITNLVGRATARASELTRDELEVGSRRLERLVATVNPAVVAVAGITAYRTGFGRRDATMGRQEEGLGECELWVVPNPSGLNARESTDSIAGWFRTVAESAGLT